MGAGGADEGMGGDDVSEKTKSVTKTDKVRAVTLRVAGVAGWATKSGPLVKLTTEERRGCWGRYCNDLRATWSDTTRLWNFVTGELWARDPGRGLAWDQKVPPCKQEREVYHMAKQLVTSLTASQVDTVFHEAYRHYRAHRLAVLRGTESVPNKRFPAPLPLRDGVWGVEVTKDGSVLFRYADQTGTDKRLTWRVVRLAVNPKNRKPLALVRQIAAMDDADRCSAAIYLRGQCGGDGKHRQGFRVKAAGGGQRREREVAVKMVARFPRTEHKTSDAVLCVRTDPECLLCWHVAYIEDDEGLKAYPDEPKPHRLSHDEVRRWVAEHRKRLQRLSDDRKFERRRPRKERLRYNEAAEPFIRKHHRRLDTLTHQVSREVVGHARRRHVRAIMLDLKDRGWIESMRWHELKTRIEYKADEFGIKVIDLSKSKAPKKKASGSQKRAKARKKAPALAKS